MKEVNVKRNIGKSFKHLTSVHRKTRFNLKNSFSKEKFSLIRCLRRDGKQVGFVVAKILTIDSF